jgi:UDP-N-acetylmuramoylalanine--D-glutamate ligase
MTAATEFSVRGRVAVVVGAARSGVAAARLLAGRGARVTVTDLRERVDGLEALRAEGVAVELGGHRPETFTGADLLVLSPGVPADQPLVRAARDRGVSVIGELELASRWLSGRIVAITGTKGKSTTSPLAGRMLAAGGHRVLVGGNIGLALSAQVESSTADTIHVVEASSFQLETTDTFHPWIAVLLNLSRDHLDRHASFEAYAAAKARIFANQTPTDWAVLNADDEVSLALVSSVRASRLLFALDRPIDEGVTVWEETVGRRATGAWHPLVPLAAVRLMGRHLLSDVLAAAAVASIAGVSRAAMTEAVSGFTGLEHALEPVVEVGGVRFVNDSKATNVAAARRAIESIDAGLVVILGGRSKGGDFGDLRAPLAERRASAVVIGEARELIAEAMRGEVPVHRAEDMAAAVRQAFALAAPGETVLLAPACASFDMFRDYAERGRAFKDAARRLEEEWNATREQ